MKFKKPEDAFNDFFIKSYPQFRTDIHVREFAQMCFTAGIAWSHARIKSDIDGDFKKLLKFLNDNDKKIDL